VTSLREIFALQGGGVVSLVGGGGKTTLLFRLAAEIALSGQNVLTTTTTKILMPRPEQSAQVIVSPHVAEVLKQAELLLSCGQRHVTAARAFLDPQHKLQGFGAGDIGWLQESGLFPWILVEADGAAQRPLKAPAAHEPVLPPSSRWVIAVVGLDAVGKPLTEEWVFRSRLFADLTGLKPGAAITETSVAAIISHEAGIMKGSPPGAGKCVFLNKAETRQRQEAGRRIAGYLKAPGGMRPGMVVIGAAAGELSNFKRFDLTGETAFCETGNSF
jgi:probable selenium-dependent hydroxylase accessory protein YqeC